MNDASPSRVRNRWTAPILISLISFVLVFGALHFLVVRPLARRGVSVERQELPPLGKIPFFSLLSERSRPLTNADLLGTIWIADFIFLRCGESCPAMTAQMSSLAAQLKREPVRFVSFDVDPDHDSVSDLAAYSRQVGADPDRWTFLHGKDRETIRSLSRDGFKLGVADGDSKDPQPILHSSRFALVDREGNLRATFDGTDPAAVKGLAMQVRALAGKRR